MRHTRLRTAFPALLLVSSLAWGQAQTTGRVQGRVVDEDGAAIAGARVTLISPALQGERTVETDERGELLAPLLPVGPYAISIAAPGKQTVQVSLRVTVARAQRERAALAAAVR